MMLVVYLHDLDGTHSFHPCAKNDPGAIAFYASPVDFDSVVELADEQTNDDGLWIDAETAQEAHLQRELRRLHRAIAAA